MAKYENKKHVHFIHEQECILRHFSPCQLRLEAHHLMRPWNGKRGMGLKANDRNLVPLCKHHHDQLHNEGDEDAYFKLLTGHPHYGRNAAQCLWLNSPHYEKEKP
jgi:hypothetical protein